MRVTIVGAGIGGISCALLLSAAGHEVKIFEKSVRLRTDGNGVIIYPNGTALLRNLGVDLDDLGVAAQSMRVLGGDGRRLMTMRLDKIADRYSSPVLVGQRGQVLGRLAERLPPGCLHLARQCVGFQHQPDGSVASLLDDGNQAESDVLVGADGHRSVIRKQLFGDVEATYTGHATWHGVATLPGGFSAGKDINVVYGKEGIFIVHPVGGGRVYWGFELPWADGDKVPSAKGAEATSSAIANLRARFGHWQASVLPTLLASVTDEDIGVFPHVMHDVPPVWGIGAVTLVGDSAHVVPPRVGMGLSQALEDAWALGQALAGAGSPAERLRAYETARLPRVRRMRATAAVMARKTLPLPPGMLRAVGSFLPTTAYQSSQVKRLSNYLNHDAPSGTALPVA